MSLPQPYTHLAPCAPRGAPGLRCGPSDAIFWLSFARCVLLCLLFTSSHLALIPQHDGSRSAHSPLMSQTSFITVFLPLLFSLRMHKSASSVLIPQLSLSANIYEKYCTPLSFSCLCKLMPRKAPEFLALFTTSTLLGRSMSSTNMTT